MLTFVGCPKVEVVFDDVQLFRSQLEGMKQIVELYISDCNSLTSFPFSILPTTLETITISDCKKLKLDPPVGEMFMEYLSLFRCDCIDDISPELLPTAHKLSVEYCHNLTRIVRKLKMACGGTQMTSLNIWGCNKLKWLPELLPSLKELQLWNCPEIKSFPEGGLQQLVIWNCKKLVNGQKGGIYRDSQSYSSIMMAVTKRLLVGNLPKIQSMLEQGQFSSFSHLTLLQSLQIGNIPNLQSLPEVALLSSLSQLIIHDCPNLKSLPVKGTPSSISKLSISECPLLTPLLEFDKGEYWLEINHISAIKINEEYL
ncbi:hypothetical protein H5410_001484 [Solanum commersonii]|uniref:Uncharacterized protein n=1 Tax=Solanum commersonii TaxID=4109 RepID=A0A9J6B098_SOLCO|nr:hypothetical protein H5410_001484 [Solanum commersonii]